MAGGKGVSTWSEAVRTWPKAVHKRRHLARSPTASSTRSVTRIQTGQPQGRTTATWPKAARDHDARGASLFAILSQASSDNPSAKNHGGTSRPGSHACCVAPPHPSGNRLDLQ